jgi:peptide deformylase
MQLPLAYYGNPILRKKCARVEAIDDNIRKLVKDMEETLLAHDGIGIAAPQVQVSLAIFLTKVPEQTGPEEWKTTDTLVFINPKILKYSEEEWERGEGCLSIPEIYGTVNRPLHIQIEATDLEGKRFTMELSELNARAFMHENDHINGVLYIDRVKGKEREDMESQLRAIKKKYASTY